MFLLKWLVTGSIVYFLYKRFFPSLPAQGPNASNDNIQKPDHNETDEGEYIDYEEVDD